MKKQEITMVYQRKLWKVIGELQHKGVYKPINEMVKAGIIEKDPKYNNLISGRVKDEQFLEQLIAFNDSLD